MIPVEIVLVPGSWPSTSVGWGHAVALAASSGVVGMGLADLTSGLTDRLSGGEDDEVDESPDDELGADDGDGEFGDLDDWEDDDDFDDFGDEDGAAADLEPRLDDLENEVGSISSTVGTVRSENEAISETVDEIEDNIRKLLEIYEMVTRGINPFVDDAGSAAGSEDAFGLFENGSSGDDESGSLDPDVANADAESFFDDDWEDDVPGDETDEDAWDDDAEDSAQADVGSDTPEEGKTFEQLKSEYEDGEADWADDDEDTESTDTADDSETDDTDEADFGDEPAEAMDDPIDDEPGAEDEGDDSEEDEMEFPGMAEAPEAEPDDEAPAVLKETERTTVTGSSESDSQETTEPADDTSADVDEDSREEEGKPYLSIVPDGYAADLVVIEWLSFLRGASSSAEAVRALRYYETIGWLGGPATEQLIEFLTGLAREENSLSTGGGTQLTVDHHTKSLRYICRLGGADVQVERLDWAGSPSRDARLEGGTKRGIQR